MTVQGSRVTTVACAAPRGTTPWREDLVLGNLTGPVCPSTKGFGMPVDDHEHVIGGVALVNQGFPASTRLNSWYCETRGSVGHGVGEEGHCHSRYAEMLRTAGVRQ